MESLDKSRTDYELEELINESISIDFMQLSIARHALLQQRQQGNLVTKALKTVNQWIRTLPKNTVQSIKNLAKKRPNSQTNLEESIQQGKNPTTELDAAKANAFTRLALKQAEGNNLNSYKVSSAEVMFSQ